MIPLGAPAQGWGCPSQVTQAGSTGPAPARWVVVQLLSRVQLFVTSQTVARQASLSSTISQSLCKLRLVMPSSHLILCRPLLLLPSIFLSIRIFSSESALCIRWPKYWRFSLRINHSNEYSRLISFRNNWFDFLAIQEALKSLFQHHSSKAPILRQSHPYLTTGREIQIETTVTKQCVSTGMGFSGDSEGKKSHLQ